MSSLQKFHRRTTPFGPPPTWPTTAIGGGDTTYGFWLGDVPSNKIIVAPKSTEQQLAWGSNGTIRNTTSITNGLANTNTLYAFGNSITTGHPAAYYCKTLTTGGYNTWYLPADEELTMVYSNAEALPFKTNNGFSHSRFWSSSESTKGQYRATGAWSRGFYGPGNIDHYDFSKGVYGVRAIRRTAI